MRIPARVVGSLALAITASWLAGACSPEVGSERWCEKMDEKPKGDWSANEAGDYARHCMFR